MAATALQGKAMGALGQGGHDVLDRFVDGAGIQRREGIQPIVNIAVVGDKCFGFNEGFQVR